MARIFDPGRVAQHGFEYQKFAYYYLISFFKNNYDKYYYEGKEDVHFESSNTNKKMFVQVKTASLSLKEKKNILIKWLSVDDIADKYILMCEKNNVFDITAITNDVVRIIKASKYGSSTSNATIVYNKYSINGVFDEAKLRSDIKKIKENLSDVYIKSNEMMFSELRNQMKYEAENAFVIDSTIEARIYNILTKILLKIHNEYVDSMSNPVELTYSEFNNFYIDARNLFPYDFFDDDYIKLKNNIDKSKLLDESLREVNQLKKLKLSDRYIVQQLINEIFYKEFRKFYYDIKLSEEIENIEELAFQNNIQIIERAMAKGQFNLIDIHFDTMSKTINHPLITKMKGVDFCTKGCYIYLTSDETDENKQISWEIVE